MTTSGTPRTFKILSPSYLQWQPTYPKSHTTVVPEPLIVRDGDMNPVFFLIQAKLIEGISLGQFAQDMRGLKEISVPYEYTVGSKGKYKRKHGTFRYRFSELRDDLANSWARKQSLHRAQQILLGNDAADDVQLPP